MAVTCLSLDAKAWEPQRQAWPAHKPWPSALPLVGQDGRPWSLAALRGKPVLINFWASWCEPCRSEMPSLERLAARHAAQGLQVLAVNFKESDAAVHRFIDATGLQLPVLFDSTGNAARALGVNIFPSTIGIDRRGQAVFSVVGECDWASAPASDWVAALL
jgi:thiol-disulfide isomerase/thioredoxin